MLLRAYPNSKLAQIMHARSLSRKFENDNIKFISICPGWVATNIVKGKLAQLILKKFAFPSDGIGLSSVLNAMLRPNVGIAATNGDEMTEHLLQMTILLILI